jgi:hypothetical protein
MAAGRGRTLAGDVTCPLGSRRPQRARCRRPEEPMPQRRHSSGQPEEALTRRDGATREICTSSTRPNASAGRRPFSIVAGVAGHAVIFEVL